MYTVCLVGRPNVGKSSLFNRLTGKRRALVHRQPGTTRDYLEKIITIENIPVRLIDLAGWSGNYSHSPQLEKSIYQQLTQTLTNSNLIIFLVDGRHGLHPLDKEIANYLRKQAIPILVAVNKIDRIEMLSLVNDFFSLGNWEYLAVSAETGLNTEVLLEKIAQYARQQSGLQPTPDISKDKVTTVAIVGRPNSGKSSLFNAILKKERTIVSEIPGTTRDTIEAQFQYQDKNFIFIDTPGVRHKYAGELEYLSDIQARKTIQRADIVILLIDITQGITSGDCQLAQKIAHNARGVIVAFNKIDLAKNKYQPEQINRLRFLPWMVTTRISALRGWGIEQLLNLLIRVSEQYQMIFPERAVKKFFQQFPEIRSAEQSGTAPPKFKIRIADSPKLPLAYIRHLQKSFRQTFSLIGVPLVFKFYYHKK